MQQPAEQVGEVQVGLGLQRELRRLVQRQPAGTGLEKGAATVFQGVMAHTVGIAAQQYTFRDPGLLLRPVQLFAAAAPQLYAGGVRTSTNVR